MKNYQKLLLAIVTPALLLAWSPSASAVTPPDDCFNINSGTQSIVGYFAYQGNNPANPACPLNVDIPSTIGFTTITTIADSAFQNKGLTSVTIPGTVTTVGVAAFAENSIGTLSLGSSVSVIGASAFRENQIEFVTIPASVTSLGDLAFQYNELTAVNILASLTEIEDGVFQHNSLTSVTIPEGVSAIGASAFEYNQLASVTLPSSLSDIGASAFGYNLLSSVTLPDNLASIDVEAFAVNRLVAVMIPDSVASLPPNVFIFQNPLGHGVLVELGSADPERANEAMNAVWYVRVYTESPSNPNSLSDYQLLEADTGFDYNADGDLGDSLGGHIINPASAIVYYENNDGISLSPSEAVTGTGLSTYLTVDNPTNDLGLYYRLGQTQDLTAPMIAGYDTVAPASPFSFLLAAAENAHTFVYSNSGEADDLDTVGSGSASGSNSGGTLAESGQSALIGVSAIVFGSAGVAALRRKQYGYAVKR